MKRLKQRWQDWIKFWSTKLTSTRGLLSKFFAPILREIDYGLWLQRMSHLSERDCQLVFEMIGPYRQVRGTDLSDKEFRRLAMRMNLPTELQSFRTARAATISALGRAPRLNLRPSRSWDHVITPPSF